MKFPPTLPGFRKMTEWLLAVVTVLLLFQVFLSFRARPLIYDEESHFMRIEHLLEGQSQQGDWGAMLPGYHLFVSAVLLLTGAHSLEAARLVTFLISMLSCLAVFLVVRELYPSAALIRTIQYATLPIVLPFFPLLYTDLLSLCLTLFALYAGLRRMSLLSSVLITLAILVRQNNLLWVPLLPLITIVRSQGRFAEPQRWMQWFRDRPRHLCVHAIPFLLPVTVFLAFAVANKSPVLNRAPDHPFPFFSLGNVYFALFLFTVLFLPFVIAKAQIAWREVRHRPGVLLFFLLLGILYWLSFHVTHPFNQDEESLKNIILLTITRGGMPKLGFFLLVLVGIITIAVTEFRWSFLPFLFLLSFLYLGGSWLIETRYAIIPIVLFLLLRKPESWRAEILQYGYNILLCWWIFF
jgi:alpha-1,2-glucosyltransferase